MDSNQLREVLKQERADQSKRALVIVGVLLAVLVAVLGIRVLLSDSAVDAERFIQSIEGR